jgi:hypothetical protein
MRIRVPADIIARADKCTHGHSCLETGRCGDKTLCKTHIADGQDILFLSDHQSTNCPYRLPFGEGQICRCPVHYWLHTNTRI